MLVKSYDGPGLATPPQHVGVGRSARVRGRNAGAHGLAAQVDEVVGAGLADDASGVSHHRAAGGNVLENDRVRAHCRAIADLPRADHLAAWPKVDAGTDLRSRSRRPCIRSDV